MCKETKGAFISSYIKDTVFEHMEIRGRAFHTVAEEQKTRHIKEQASQHLVNNKQKQLTPEAHIQE